MSSGEYLFPERRTRRDFLWTAGAAGVAAAGLAGAGRHASAAEDRKLPVKIGTGHFTYTLDEAWGRLPAGMRYGFGCAIVVDGQDRVIVTSRSASPCVAIFDKDGKLVETWSKEFAEGV